MRNSHAILQTPAGTQPDKRVAGYTPSRDEDKASWTLDRTQLSAPVRKLLLLLATRGRLELLPDILDVYRERLMEHRQVVQAEVTTAVPLSPERVAELQQRLARLTGRTVAMTTKVNEAIIGGVVTRIGSTVYDGSVATQLAKVRERLSERS